MTNATAAEYRAAHEQLLRNFWEQVFRLHQVRETSAIVWAQTRQAIAEAEATQQQRSSHLNHPN